MSSNRCAPYTWVTRESFTQQNCEKTGCEAGNSCNPVTGKCQLGPITACDIPYKDRINADNCDDSCADPTVCRTKDSNNCYEKPPAKYMTAPWCYKPAGACTKEQLSKGCTSMDQPPYGQTVCMQAVNPYDPRQLCPPDQLGNSIQSCKADSDCKTDGDAWCIRTGPKDGPEYGMLLPCDQSKSSLKCGSDGFCLMPT